MMSVAMVNVAHEVALERSAAASFGGTGREAAIDARKETQALASFIFTRR
jgi:hypothetical protein